MRNAARRQARHSAACRVTSGKTVNGGDEEKGVGKAELIKLRFKNALKNLFSVPYNQHSERRERKGGCLRRSRFFNQSRSENFLIFAYCLLW